MMKKDLVKTIADKTGMPSDKAVVALDQMFVNRAIPSVLRDKVIANIAEGADITIGQAQKAVGAVFGKLTEDPAIFELASNQLVAAWINDCDGCNACGAASLVVHPELQRIETTKTRQK